MRIPSATPTTELLATSIAAGQTAPPAAPAAGTAGPAPAGTQRSVPRGAAAGQIFEVEGRIESVDAAARRLTLEDGTTLVIPKSVKATEAELKPGTLVKASVAAKGRRRVVIDLQLTPGAP